MGASNSARPDTYGAERTNDLDGAAADKSKRSRVAPTGADEVYVVGAGSVLVNGCYKRVYLTNSKSKAKKGMPPGVGEGLKASIRKSKVGMPAERNGAAVYINARGFQMTREIVDEEAGWIIGRRTPDNLEAFYAVKDRSFLPPPKLWGKTWQYLGQDPCPSIALHELDAVALGYDEAEVEAAAEQAKIELAKEEKEAERRRQAVEKVKLAAAKAREDKAKRKQRKKELRIVADTKGDGSEFFPVSPDRQRALARRPKTQALAWQTPDHGKSLARKSLAKKALDDANWERFEENMGIEMKADTPMSPAIQEHIDRERGTQEERAKSFVAKREERYQYYQNRLRKKQETRVPDAPRVPLSNLSSNSSGQSDFQINRKLSTTQMI